MTEQDNGPTQASSSPHCTLIDCHHQGHGNTVLHHGDSKSSSNNCHCPINCKSKADGGCCCVQSCRAPGCPALNLNSLRCVSCQSSAVGHIDDVVCSLASSPSLSKSPSLCPAPSICCHQHNPRSAPCYSHHVCLTQVRNSVRREQSPSPPPLSPIPSDIRSKSEEKPPALLHHIQEDGAEPSLPQTAKGGRLDASHQDVDAATEEELEGATPRSIQPEQNPSGNLLQDVVDRFSEKLETITPLDKDSPLTSSAMNTEEEEEEEEEPQSPDDGHLTEIITTVLHSGSNSDYNLSELFNRHDSKQPKPPNTRSRCRQKVLAAMSTPTDDPSSRRHKLQIKRELAMFDQAYCRRKEPPAKRGKLRNGDKVSSPVSGFSLDAVLVKEEPGRETESPEARALVSKQDVLNGDEPENKNVIVDVGCIAENREAETGESRISEELGVEEEKVTDGTPNTLTALSETGEVKEEIQAVIVTEEVHTIKTEEREMEIVTGETEPSGLGNQTPITTPESQCNKPCGVNREGSASGQGSDNGPGRDKEERRPARGRRKTSLQSRGNCFDEERRTRRNIVPPQRFSSYVTEPRKMYFVACFSEGIFNQRVPKEKGLTCSLDNSSKDPDLNNTEPDSRKEAPPSPELSAEPTHRKQGETSNADLRDQSTGPVKEKSPPKQSSPNQIEGGGGAARPHGKLRSSPRKPKDSESKTLSRTHQDLSKVGVATSDRSTGVPNAPVFLTEYVSPIKLMYVSPLRDEDGVKYSLKSAGSGSSPQAQESFDPCEVSSWAGTPARNTESNPSKLKSVSSPVKSATSLAKSASASPKSTSSPPKSASASPKAASSPPKSTSSPSKSTSSPSKSASSPPKSASSTPKSASSPPKSAVSPSKVGSRRSVDGTPPKCASGTESLRSAGDFTSHETTPPKRRPGRPKKLGPQQENKVKRPIGRPRKQKPLDSVSGADTVKGTAVEPSDKEENVNKNLKITVVYGRSRRNKRMVCEGFEQLPTETHDAWQAADQNNDWSSLNQNSETCPAGIKAASTEWSEDLNLVRPVKECAPHTSSNIICQKRDAALPVRKPGRPAKVKISGISVTVTTVSPRQRKIQLNKERRSPETLNRRKALLPVFKSAKEPRTISHQTTSSCSQTEERLEEKRDDGDKSPNRQVAVRHSLRVRKPSMYFLHSVATSRSFSRSTALLKRSKQVMLNKAMNERKEEAAQNAAETSGEKDQVCGQEGEHVSQDFSQVAGVSVEPIFSREDTLRWWAESTEEKTLNQELARRIRIISDTWVSDSVESRDEVALNTRMGIKGNSSSLKKSKHSSVVRILFDCPPSRPRSCSMQQLCSWFMQTTETQSLDIVKRTSSRNPYEHMHFPRTANKTHVCPSPQAERLRKHVKKFAKTVPKSPHQHRRVQRRLRDRNKALLATGRVKRQLFSPSFVPRCPNQGAAWFRDRPIGKYQTTLLRARTRFLTRKERVRWPKRQRNTEKVCVLYGQKGTGLQRKYKASCGSATEQLLDCLENRGASSSVDQTQEPADVPKEHTLSSKAWSPETLKECRVFLRKINSPDNESVEEEWDSCTVTLDDGSPSAYQFARSESEMVGLVKAVKTDRKRSRSRSRTAPSTALEGSAPKSTQEQVDAAIGRRKGKHKRPGVASTESLQPAKTLRQSRMRGLSGPRWCDFVFEN